MRDAFGDVIPEKITVQQYRRIVSDKQSKTAFGWFEKDGKMIFMRSSWELNYAHYLNWLVTLKQIAGWKYESAVFWFEKIRRGVRSFKPDFEVTLLNGGTEFHEVKGWMDDKSRTKLKRMRIYHPSVKIVLIDQKRYKVIASQSAMVPGWGKWITEKPKKESNQSPI